ncbi:hypothetical protein EVG20_g10851 [Dentipellis fragilis]|uniref:Uncharacterized protein n=1 Tax=Dentipellis fragilis TaxID=205917 RepID=A0A4Y9XNS6_9AGAM|nr:hypothetical protein EVG20_g10851 [Dentipellis fragilis]
MLGPSEMAGLGLVQCGILSPISQMSPAHGNSQGSSMVIPIETRLPTLQMGLNVGEFSNINVPSRRSTPVLSGRGVQSRLPQSEINRVTINPASMPDQISYDITGSSMVASIADLIFSEDYTFEGIAGDR